MEYQYTYMSLYGYPMMWVVIVMVIVMVIRMDMNIGMRIHIWKYSINKDQGNEKTRKQEKTMRKPNDRMMRSTKHT